jgi:hypothetical protein
MRLPTYGGSGDSIALPVSGPSGRTVTVAAIAIALSGIAIGGVIAWRAHRRAPATPPPIPETAVALVETPQLVGGVDAGVQADETVAPSGSTGSRTRGATRATGSSSAPSASGAVTPAVATGGTSAATTPRSRAGEAPASVHGGAGAGSAGSQARGAGGGAANGTSETAGGGSASRGGGSARSAGGGEPAGGGSTGAGVSEPGGGLQPRGPSVGGYVQGDETDATGTMDPRVFSFVYRHYRSQIASCHSMVSRGQEVVGTMRVRVRLGTDGHVVRTRVLSNTTHNEMLATCVQNQVRTWRYPQPEGGEVEFDYNFGFGN